MPVVVTAPLDADERRALAALSDCRALGPADDATLSTVVERALETYDERRRRDAESDLFTTLLAEGELAVFAKDREGRHLHKADVEDDADPASVVGKTDVEITPDYLRDQARADLEDDLQVVETGEPVYDRVREYGHDGYDHWSQTTKVPWYDGDEVIGLAGYALDVSDRERYQRHLAEQADRIDQFIDYVAHDLRTPLQIVYGEIDRARAVDGIERIESIVEDLSALTKRGESSGLSSGALRSFRADSFATDFPNLVETAWSFIGPDTATLVVDLPPETTVAADAETLRPVVENLLKNAVDHAGPNVTVRVGALERGFYVEDDGPGIPVEERSEVTNRGYTTAEAGTGTGLDIVAETVDQQGWELRVTDAVGAATRSSAADPSDGPTADPSDGPTADGGRTGGARFEISGVPMVTRPDFGVRPGREVALEETEDVGPVATRGSAAYDEGADEWTVVANGANVWGNTHEFHYVHAGASAPVRIEGRIADLDGPDEFTKAGFAVRASADERAPFGYVGHTVGHGSEITWRERADGFTHSDQFEELPGTFSYYRVDYVDGVVTLFLSESGDEWIPVDQQPLALGGAVSLGPMVCSHSEKRTAEATFADVRAWGLEPE
ncbi:MAG: ATP-binding protein [Halosimplex sp.]